MTRSQPPTPATATPSASAHGKDPDTKHGTDPKDGLVAENVEGAEGDGGGSDTKSGTTTKTGIGAQPKSAPRRANGGGGSDTGGGGGPKTGLEPQPKAGRSEGGGGSGGTGGGTDPKTGLEAELREPAPGARIKSGLGASPGEDEASS